MIMRRYLIVSDSIISRRRCSKDNISYMKKNTLSNLPNNCVNARGSYTLCVQTGTTEEPPRTSDMSVVVPQGATDYSLRTAALEYC